jgi:hypothetical protein
VLINKVKDVLPDGLNAIIEFQRPFFRNFQIMIRMPGCDCADTAFAIKAELQQILDDAGISARGKVCKAGLEPDKERRAILTAYLNTVRAVEKRIPDKKP